MTKKNSQQFRNWKSLKEWIFHPIVFAIWQILYIGGKFYAIILLGKSWKSLAPEFILSLIPQSSIMSAVWFYIITTALWVITMTFAVYIIYRDNSITSEEKYNLFWKKLCWNIQEKKSKPKKSLLRILYFFYVIPMIFWKWFSGILRFIQVHQHLKNLKREKKMAVNL